MNTRSKRDILETNNQIQALPSSQRLVTLNPLRNKHSFFSYFGYLLLDSCKGEGSGGFKTLPALYVMDICGQFFKSKLIDTTRLSFSYFFFFTFTGHRFWHLITASLFQCYHFHFPSRSYPCQPAHQKIEKNN